MNVEKLQKLWNLATRNPNENEALVAARKFVRAINREQVSVHLYKGAAPASQEQIQRAIDNAFGRDLASMQTVNQRRFLAANARARESLGVPAAYGAPVMMPPTDRLSGALSIASSIAGIYSGFKA